MHKKNCFAKAYINKNFHNHNKQPLSKKKLSSNYKRKTVVNNSCTSQKKHLKWYPSTQL